MKLVEERGAKESKMYTPGVGLIKDSSLLLIEYGFLRE